MTKRVNSKDFLVRVGKEVDLAKWPTSVKPVYKSKKAYQKLLATQVEELSALQRVHYASNRYAVLLIFQGMDSAGDRSQPGGGARCGRRAVVPLRDGDEGAAVRGGAHSPRRRAPPARDSR